ncbi:MAG: HesA/MoeB/ThiF family protein [Acidobacteriota bacterium]
MYEEDPSIEPEVRRCDLMDDEAILSLAREQGISASAAQVEVLRRGIVPARYAKNLLALSIDEQIRLGGSRALVCGCGGLGGIVALLLARAGIGYLRLIDSDVFAPSNLNRQLLCHTDSLGLEKARVAEERVRSVNPLIDVEAHVVSLDETNANDLVRDVDVVLDAVDNLAARFILADAARRAGIPFIHAAVAGWWGQLSTFLPGSDRRLGGIYGSRRAKDPSEDAIGVLGPTASIVGSLEALEAIRVLGGRKPAYGDSLLYFDGESGRMEIIALA